MKNIKTLLVISASIFLSVLGCTDNEIEMIDRDYIIENDTDFLVNIKFYGRIDGQLSIKSKTLENRGGQLSARLRQSDFDNSGYNTSSAFQGDSVRVTINNSKFYTNVFNTINYIFSEPLNRNLFIHSNYENLGNERYLFKITQQDYENAEDCNGNCD
jgi:hypothetical protein